MPRSKLGSRPSAKQMFLGHADALNNLLFERRAKLRGSKAAALSIPMTPPMASMGLQPSSPLQ
jgi:hypothetical protein